MQVFERVNLARQESNPETLALLFADRSPQVRRAVARNPAAPTAVVVAAATGVAKTVRAAAAANPTLPPEYMDDLSFDAPSVREQLARNHACRPDILERLALTDRTTSIRVFAIANPGLPTSAMVTIATDSTDAYRSALLDNPALPARVLDLLCEGTHNELTRAREHRAARICEATGIDTDNHEALEFVRRAKWWTLNNASTDVRLALELFPNPR